MTKKDPRLELASLDKLVIFVNRASRLVLHLFRDIFEEACPFRGRSKLRDKICGHLNSFVGGQDETTSGNMMYIVEVSSGRY